jgi:hypothetical protein
VFAFSVVTFILLYICLGMAKSFIALGPVEWAEWLLQLVSVGGMVWYEGRMRRQGHLDAVN